MRLRTLPLSLAGSAMGVFTAASVTQVSFWPVFTVLLTTALLQILSNLSNELGDTLNGTDTSERLGIHYSLQDGDMTVPQMKRLIACTAVCCCLSGLCMRPQRWMEPLAFRPHAAALRHASARSLDPRRTHNGSVPSAPRHQHLRVRNPGRRRALVQLIPVVYTGITGALPITEYTCI